MRRFFLYSIIIASINSCTAETEDPKSRLENNIQARLNQIKGIFAVAFKDLNTGDTLFINADEGFHAASTMKTPVMIEVYKQADAGLFSMEDSIEVKNEFVSIVDGSLYSMDISDDSEPELYAKIGSKIPVRDLVIPMITYSSNLATNILIDKVGAKNVTASMRVFGAMKIEVLRGVEDIKAYELGMSNTTTARDLQIILEAIAKKTAGLEESCNEMLDILLQQKFNEIIPSKLPEETEVAHKTGSITGVQHDSGIVYLPDGTSYVIVLLSKELENANDGIAALAEVSALVYEFVVKEKN
jgi:beta-lactamase class A